MTIFNEDSMYLGDDTPEELFGPYVNNKNNVNQYLRDINQVCDNISEVLNINENTFYAWTTNQRSPNKSNANKITLLYIILYDQILFMAVYINILSIDMDTNIVKTINKNDLTKLYTMNSLLYTVELLRDVTKRTERNKNIFMDELWTSIDSVLSQYIGSPYKKWELEDISSSFIKKVKEFYTCDCNPIEDYYELFEELNFENLEY